VNTRAAAGVFLFLDNVRNIGRWNFSFPDRAIRFCFPCEMQEVCEARNATTRCTMERVALLAQNSSQISVLARKVAGLLKFKACRAATHKKE
jgi:hypothetical protein